MDAREERGLVIAATSKIEKNKLGWKVPSQSGNGTYIVNLDHGEPYCTCPDFEKRHLPCKHIHAVEYVILRETKPDGSTTYTQSVKVTCTQEWPAYDAAQMHEQGKFVMLLRDLWNRMWHFYNFNQEVFLQHYHKRSNIESTFAMIKAKFGASVRAKTPVAQVNEVLCKILCHNICVLIISIYELGLEPTFWTFDTKEATVPKVLEN